MKLKTSVTIAEVAKLAGVSTATAGRVLGNYGYSSQENRKKVLSAAKRLGYRPNAIARGLITGNSRTLGVVAGDIRSPFYGAILRGIADVAEEKGFGLLITSSDEEFAKEVRAVEMLRAKQVDGLIVSPCATDKAPHLQEIAEAGMPLVLIDREVKSLEVDTVGAENVESARAGVARLLAAGHRRIGMVGELMGAGFDEVLESRDLPRLRGLDAYSLYPSWQRLNGFLLAHRDAGVEVMPELIGRAGAYAQDAARRAAAQLLDRADPPTAILTSDGVMTAGLMAALSERQIRIPDDLSVCCFDDLDWMAFLGGGLDAIAQPRRAMGRAAAEMVLERISGSHIPPRQLKFTPRYVARNSVRALA